MTRVIAAEDRSASKDKNGKLVLKRYLQVEGDSIPEIALSTLIPQIGSRHPVYTGFYLESIGEFSKTGNKDRKVQTLVPLVYTTSITGSSVMHFGGEPWELGAQNVQISFIEQKKPLISGTSADGTETVQCLNSAGCQILAETTETITVLSFMFSVKAKSTSLLNTNSFAIVNASTETVAGIVIPERQGKLLPMSANYVIEYEDNGTTVKRRYWNYNAQIHISQSGWAKKLLDVGTMAKFKETADDGTEKVRDYPENIYKYTPWKSSDMIENMKVSPKYGNIDAVIKAMKEYWQVTGNSDKIPYEEVTEPMPLKADGTIYEEALKDPKLFKYREIELYDCSVGSWNSYNLPKDEA